MAIAAKKNFRRGLSLWWIVPITLFLISMGMKMPNAGAPQTPKPRPRAVVESCSKSSQDATPKKIVEAMELYDSVEMPQRHEYIAGPCSEPCFQYSSAIPAPSGARAPPFPIS